MRAAVFVMVLGLMAPAAHAGAVLDRVRQAGVVQCGAVTRPGLALQAPDGSWHGLLVDLCHAVAVAALGPDGASVFHAYPRYRAVPGGAWPGDDDVAFLTTSELLADGAVGAVLPGPAVFINATALLVDAGSSAQEPAQLAGQRVCAEPGTGPERNVIAWFAARRIPIHFFMFQEADEMLDAFYAGRCQAIANDAVVLAAIALQAAADDHDTRLLAPVAAAPVNAYSPRNDGDWAAVIAWTVATLMQPGDASALPVRGADLGLAADWQQAVLKAGGYGRLYDDNIGQPLRVPAGLNGAWRDGGLLCPPASE